MKKDIDIKAFANGDHKEFERIVDMYNREISYYVYQYIENEEDTEDIVQETFTALFVKRKSFKTAVHINNFLYMAAKNKSLNHLKSKKTRSGHKEKIRLQSHDFQEPEVLRANVLTDNMKWLYEGIEKLPPTARKALELRLEGKSIADIAAILNISTLNVSSQIYHAKQALLKPK